MTTSGGISAAELARVLAGIGAPPPVANVPPPTAAHADAAEATRALATLAPLTPQLLCTVCRGPLDQAHIDQGTHAACDPFVDPGPPPPSTLADLRDILIHYDRTRPRSLQTEIGPSEIAVACDRRLGYALRGTPEQPDGRVPWAPLLGTAVHAMLAEALMLDNERLGRERWLIERKVWPDPGVFGHCDALDTDHDTVLDWKLVGKTTLTSVKRHGAGPQYKGQSHLYGRGWQRVGFAPRYVRVVFLARSHDIDESEEWTEPYSRVTADGLIDRMYGVLTMTAELNVEANPGAWAEVPALPGRDCRLCPFYRRGGPADATGCPGDVEADARRDAKFRDGLICP